MKRVFKNSDDIGKLKKAVNIANALYSQKKINICRLIGMNPGITQAEVIRCMNEPQSTSSKYLAQMVKESLIDVRHDGKNRCYFLSMKFKKVKEGVAKFSLNYE